MLRNLNFKLIYEACIQVNVCTYVYTYFIRILEKIPKSTFLIKQHKIMTTFLKLN